MLSRKKSIKKARQKCEKNYFFEFIVCRLHVHVRAYTHTEDTHIVDIRHTFHLHSGEWKRQKTFHELCKLVSIKNFIFILIWAFLSSLSSFLLFFFLLFCVFAICHLEIPNSWYNKGSPCKQTSSLRRGRWRHSREEKQKGQKVNLNREWTHKTVRLWEIDSSSDCWLKEIDISCCFSLLRKIFHLFCFLCDFLRRSLEQAAKNHQIFSAVIYDYGLRGFESSPIELSVISECRTQKKNWEKLKSFPQFICFRSFSFCHEECQFQLFSLAASFIIQKDELDDAMWKSAKRIFICS